jgi:hypothetical protein
MEWQFEIVKKAQQAQNPPSGWAPGGGPELAAAALARTTGAPPSLAAHTKTQFAASAMHTSGL